MEANLLKAFDNAKDALIKAVEELNQAEARLNVYKGVKPKSEVGKQLHLDAREAVRLAQVKVDDISKMVVDLHKTHTSIKANLTFDDIVNEGEHAIITPVQ